MQTIMPSPASAGSPGYANYFLADSHEVKTGSHWQLMGAWRQFRCPHELSQGIIYLHRIDIPRPTEIESALIEFYLKGHFGKGQFNHSGICRGCSGLFYPEAIIPRPLRRSKIIFKEVGCGAASPYYTPNGYEEIALSSFYDKGGIWGLLSGLPGEPVAVRKRLPPQLASPGYRKNRARELSGIPAIRVFRGTGGHGVGYQDIVSTSIDGIGEVEMCPSGIRMGVYNGIRRAPQKASGIGIDVSDNRGEGYLI